jgi:AraC-like DNA-binding protein
VEQKICGKSGFAACLGSLLNTATTRHRELSPAEGSVLQRSIVDCILLLAARDPDKDQASLSQPQQEKLSHLKSLALRSIQLPDLNPGGLAREAGVSPRTLHRLFNGSGVTFRSWLRDCRLERCWMELTDPACRHGTIAAVAFRWGFNDLRTFNRAFSARYNMTPQAAREAGRAGTWARILPE